MSIQLTSSALPLSLSERARGRSDLSKFTPALGFLSSSIGQIGAGIAAHRSSRLIAKQQERAGRAAAEKERRLGRKVAGAQAAAFGKAGVQISAGTPLAVMRETAATAELNALTEQFRFDSAASIERAKGGALLGQSIIGALGSFLKAEKALPQKKRGG